ncbi:hypothetical protein DSECCO2_167720 [anaerobic digester metagenome]|jgi:epoxyqueuosine reductase|nr:4Fe-4S binding protein [Methanoculleus horonobensis]
MDCAKFFGDEGIDAFARVGLEELPDADRVSVLQFLPAAQSVIVFGKEVPAPVYRMPPGEKTREMLRIAESLDGTARRLAGLLGAEDIASRPVPLYLPVRVVEGKVQGVVRLKKIAAAAGLGEIGMNTLLLNRRFGPRLLLSGVVAGPGAPEFEREDGAGGEGAPLCTRCGACLRACPEGALGPDGVDAFRCRTVRAWVPPPVVPAVKWLLRRRFLIGGLAPLAPLVARAATIRCSLCVTGCPALSGAEVPANTPGRITG